MDRPEKRQLKSTRGRGERGRQKTAVKILTGTARPLQQRVSTHEPLHRNSPVWSPAGIVQSNGSNQLNAGKILLPVNVKDLQGNKRVICNNETLVKKKNKKVSSRCRVVELPQKITYDPFKQQQQPPLSPRKLNICQIAPVKPMPRYEVVPSVENQTNYHQPVNFRAQPMSTVHFPSTSQETEKISSEENNDNNILPPDLQELNLDWNEPPQGHLSEVINWLSLPVTTTEVPVPSMVTNIQEMMAEWEETHENKVQQVLEWLGYSSISTLGNCED